MKKPIRILHVFGGLHAGGAESRTMDIYRKIDRQKVQFDFAIHTSEECFFSKEVKSLGGKIHSFPRFNGKNYLTYKKAWESFFKNHSDYKIIHGHQTSTAFIYLNVAKKYNIPVRIAHARNSRQDNLIKKVTTRLSSIHATNKFAVSKLASINQFGTKATENGNISILPNAIDTQKFIFNTSIRKDKRKELNIKNKFVIGHIGRFHPQKNHKFLLEIFRSILDIDSNAVLLLIGNGKLENDIKQKIIDLNLEESVILAGTRNDIPELLQAMDILLFPSYFEGLPGVVLESQAAGLPCVISNTITSEVKLTQLVEYVSLEENAQYWAEKVLNYKTNFEHINTYKKFVEKGYDIHKVSEWYQNFYLSNWD